MTTPQRIVLVVGLAVTVVACGRGWRCPGHAATCSRANAIAQLDEALRRIDATDDQRVRARMIVGRSLTEWEPWPDAMARLRADVIGAWTADRVDPAAWHARIDTEAEALRSFGHGFIDDAVALHDTLTPAQRTRLARDAKHGASWWRRARP